MNDARFDRYMTDQEAIERKRMQLRDLEREISQLQRDAERRVEGKPTKFTAAPAKPKAFEPMVSLMSAGLNSIGAKQ